MTRRLTRGARLTRVLIVLALLATSGCRSSSDAQGDVSFDDLAFEDLDHEVVRVETLPADAPTAAEIASATSAAPSIYFETSYDSIVDALDLEVSGVLLADARKGFRTSTTMGPLGREREAALWLDGEHYFVSDWSLSGQLRVTAQDMTGFLGLGFTERSIDPRNDVTLTAAIEAELASTTGLEVVGIEEADGTPLLRLVGASVGTLEAPVTLDLWLDGEDRLVKLVTTTLSVARPPVQPAIRTLRLRYLVDSPLIPERPALYGSESVGPIGANRGAPLGNEIVAATAQTPFINFEQNIEYFGLRLHQEGSLDVLAERGYASNWVTVEPDTDDEWIEETWYEDGDLFVTTDGPGSDSRPAYGGLGHFLGLSSILQGSLNDVLDRAVGAHPFIVVGAEEIDGQPVLQLMGSRRELNDEVLVQVWVDVDDRLVRLVTNTWKSTASSLGNAAVETTTFSYPLVAPEIPPRP